MTNVTILCIFRTHAQKEYRKVVDMKGTYIIKAAYSVTMNILGKKKFSF